MKTFYQKISYVALLVVLSIVSCRTPVQEPQEKSGDNVGKQFLRVNQYLRDKHQDQISAFVDRVGWNMAVSSTGLWYSVEHSGDGKAIRKDSRVTYTYSSMLLDGTPCYEADRNHPKTITAGKGGVESGVEEGLLKMNEGDSATLIIPPHLGHGNFGDRNKIPGNSVIIYKLRVLKVS